MGRPRINAYIYSSSSFSLPLSPISPIVCGLKKHEEASLGRHSLPRHGFGRAVAAAALLTGGLWFLGPSNEGLLSVSSRKKRASSPPVCLSAGQPAGFNPTPQNKRCSTAAVCSNRQEEAH